MAGTLYLIPTPLGDGDTPWLPEGERARVTHLTHFVVEAEKTARKHLKQLGVTTPIRELVMHTLNEHTKPADVAALSALPGWRVKSAGAYFAWVEHPFAASSADLARRIAPPPVRVACAGYPQRRSGPVRPHHPPVLFEFAVTGSFQQRPQHRPPGFVPGPLLQAAHRRCPGSSTARAWFNAPSTACPNPAAQPQ